MDQLGRPPALGEAERAQAALDEVGHQLRAPRRARDARRPSSSSVSGGFQSATVRSARGAASSPITVVSTPSRRVRELARVRDRRRGEQELRVGAVDPREPPQPAQHVGDVRAEDAAVDVRLVDDHVARGSRARRPSGRGAGARRRGACPGWRGSGSPTCAPASAARRRCRRRRSRRAACGSRNDAERPQLVLRQRLRRVEVERALLRLARERVEHRQVEGERLPGGGAGRDDEVLAARGRRPRPRPGARRARRRPGPPAPRARAGAAPSGSGARIASRAADLGAEVGELLALEQVAA